MWVSVVISTVFYLVLGIVLFGCVCISLTLNKKKGICGAMTYQMDPSSDILAILSAHGIIKFTNTNKIKLFTLIIV